MKIVCFHIVNDFSGATKMLAATLDGLLQRSIKVDLVTSRGGGLDTLKNENLRTFHFPYSHSKNLLLAGLDYLFSQFFIFFFAFKYFFAKKTVFYINTIKPVGAAFAGKIIRKKIVYHYHENAFVVSKFYRFLCNIMQIFADKIICVSQYQRSFLKRQKDIFVVPNFLSESFVNDFEQNIEKNFKQKRILLFSNLRFFKGMLEFIELAKRLPDYNFELVIGEKQQDIQQFFNKNKIDLPKNLTLTERQSDVVPIYQRASLLLNLSNREFVIETFGLTALEAMTAGVPVIVPTVGGIAELVEEGKNGYKIDVQQLDKIEQQIKILLTDFELYKRLSNNALKTAQNFDCNITSEKILQIINF